MADLHKAIRAIHNNVITIQGDTKEDIVALDNSGNNVTINWTSVEAWSDPNAYKIKRLEEYPSLQEFAEAYCEKEIGEDSTKWDVYKTAYNKVRTDNPKE
jgi:hypothetical protein